MSVVYLFMNSKKKQRKHFLAQLKATNASCESFEEREEAQNHIFNAVYCECRWGSSKARYIDSHGCLYKKDIKYAHECICLTVYVCVESSVALCVWHQVETRNAMKSFRTSIHTATTTSKYLSLVHSFGNELSSGQKLNFFNLFSQCVDSVICVFFRLTFFPFVLSNFSFQQEKKNRTNQI